MVWRVSGEMLLQMQSITEVYDLLALAMFGIADFALCVGICCIVGGSHPNADILTQVFITIRHYNVLKYKIKY